MNSIFKVFCNGCSRETKHYVLNVVRQEIEDVEDPRIRNPILTKQYSAGDVMGCSSMRYGTTSAGRM